MAAVPHLLDTNILLRLAQHEDPEHALVKAAIDALIEEGADLCYTPQNVVEFWNVFTRPRNKNGFGMTSVEADRQTLLLERQFTFLQDNEQIHTEWRRLVIAHAVSGVQVHDARLVAVMQVYAIPRLLTLNGTDFRRYPEITVVHPREFQAAT
jgi:predicted nucleic acid-binding protein